MIKGERKRSLGTGEKPVVKAKYEHMMREDHATWSAFLVSGDIKFEEVWYDVHVGAPMAVPLGSPEFMKDVVNGISRKRIDVIGKLNSEIHIIEVKPHANMQAVGQVIIYRDLFIKEYELEVAVRCLIVAMTCDRDILETAEKMDVKIVAILGVVL